MMEAVSTSETSSINFYQATWCNNPEDSHLHHNKKPLRKKILGWEDNIKIFLRDISSEDVYWIELIQDGIQWHAFMVSEHYSSGTRKIGNSHLEGHDMLPYFYRVLEGFPSSENDSYLVVPLSLSISRSVIVWPHLHFTWHLR
jgi:hypothetical protein